MDIIQQPKRNVILDATMLSAFISCERFYDLNYLHHFRKIGGSSNSLEVGSIAHKVLEVFYDNKIKGFSDSVSQAAGLTAGMMYIQGCEGCRGWDVEGDPPCGHLPDEYPGVKSTPPDNETKPRRTGYNWVMETMEQYFDFYKDDSWIPLESEQISKDVLYEDDEVRILWVAKIDVKVDTGQGIFPIDHKTMSQDRGPLALNTQFMGQCLVCKTRKMIVNKIGWQVSLPAEKKFKRVPMGYSAARLHEWQSETLPFYVYKMLECNDAEFYPMRLSHCENKWGHCPFVDVCMADPILREDELRNSFEVGTQWDPTKV